jgi:hypothetical protein
MAYFRILENIHPAFGWSMDLAAPGQLGDCLPPPQLPTGTARDRKQIQFIEVRDVRPSRSGGRVAVSFTEAGAMNNAKREKFIKRFMDPMRRHELSSNLCRALNWGNHPVRIAWGNGQFGFNGTIALDRRQAVGGSGSAAVIFIDEEASDLRKLETVGAHPDVGLFHELVHALYIQRGVTLNDEKEMENLVIGLGRHSGCRVTENAYRDARGLPPRCCRDRERL